MTARQATQPYVIGPVECKPGESARGLIPVGIGVDGQQLGIPLIVLHGAYQGPVLGVNAGVHGDECDGMEAIRTIAAELDPAELRGTLVAMPCLNVPAFEVAGRANTLDQANLNRIFPGDPEGSYTQRLAATFVREVIPVIDALVDLHTGGTLGEIAPLAIVQRGHEELATALGLAAGHELIWKGGAWGGTARASTLQAGKPAITVEAGGGMYRDDVVALHAGTIRNVMRHFGMIPGEVRLRERYTAVHATFARAAAGGFFLSHVQPGTRCSAGDVLATIVDHYGDVRERVLAPEDGVLLWTRRLRKINPGDETVIFGPVEGEIAP